MGSLRADKYRRSRGTGRRIRCEAGGKRGRVRTGAIDAGHRAFTVAEVLNGEFARDRTQLRVKNAVDSIENGRLADFYQDYDPALPRVEAVSPNPHGDTPATQNVRPECPGEATRRMARGCPFPLSRSRQFRFWSPFLLTVNVHTRCPRQGRACAGPSRFKGSEKKDLPAEDGP